MRCKYHILCLCTTLLFLLGISCTPKQKQSTEEVDTEKIYLPEEIDEPPKMPESVE